MRTKHSQFQAIMATAPVASAALNVLRVSAWLLNFSLRPVEMPVTTLREIAALVVSPTYLPRVIANHLSLLSGMGVREPPGRTEYRAAIQGPSVRRKPPPGGGAGTEAGHDDEAHDQLRSKNLHGGAGWVDPLASAAATLVETAVHAAEIPAAQSVTAPRARATEVLSVTAAAR
jgi:hypothetical protein